MRHPIVGVKAYGWDWSTRHGLSMHQAAARMAAQGIDWALVQNLVDPLPASAVDQAPPQGVYDDRDWVSALQDQGLRVYQSSAVFFSPEDFARDPDLRPVDQFGQVFEPFGWYHGLCPTHPRHLEHKAERLAQAIGQTRPDGVFLSFIRFPGFWEMWLPSMRRSRIREYCFCERCMTRFFAATSIDPPAGGLPAWRLALCGELRARWTDWKCGWIAAVVQRLRAAVLEARPGLDLVLNGFGLGRDDLGNAVEEVLGQRLGALEASVDHFDLMFYHQILKRESAPWIARRIAQARSETGRNLLACLQVRAEYLEPLYVRGRRRLRIGDREWEGALRAVASAGADGVLAYSWRDLLADEATGGSRVRELQRYRDGSLAAASPGVRTGAATGPPPAAPTEL
ncbi:MAG: hypothetical protein KGM91_22465 [Burkholderiales bacterium]|nr:hypothetical protein [Burkholderiales bacterium]